MEARMEWNFKTMFQEVVDEVEKHVIGQSQIVRLVFAGILAGGHILMEGAPGLGKTVLVKTFASVLDLPFSRIQFTPDLMPVDITGTTIVSTTEQGVGFLFQPGPIFGSLVLADEINRATPKTQSALLEAMQEGSVTVGNTTHRLPEPFFVLATQNPLEMEGTYRLPEAQLDRFMFKLKIRLPEEMDIHRIIDSAYHDEAPRGAVTASRQQFLHMKQTAARVLVPSTVKNRAVRIMMETHPDRTSIPMVKDYVKCGASPRGVQSMISAARVKALAEGRFNVAMEDIMEMALPCLNHRIFLSFRAAAERVDAEEIIAEILRKVK